MRIAVTGGAGFLGSHVAARAVAEGHDCTIVDVAEPVESTAAAYCRADLLSPQLLREAFRGADAVCHLAGVGDVYLAAEDPARAAMLNVAGTANVAEACVAEGVGKLVYASTWEV